MPLLGFLIKKGNTTVYEWRTGAQPAHVEKQSDRVFNFGEENDSATKEADEQENKIDFGDFDANALGSNEQQSDEIDWGNLEAAVEHDLHELNLADTNEIDYDLEELKNQICVEDTGVYIPSDQSAKGNDALSVLEWPETRSLFMNDLLKVRVG